MALPQLPVDRELGGFRSLGILLCLLTAMFLAAFLPFAPHPETNGIALGAFLSFATLLVKTAPKTSPSEEEK